MKRYTLVDTQAAFRLYRMRLLIAGSGVLLLSILLLMRFIWLQGFNQEHYLALAENNRIVLLPAPPPRGTIRDRNGVVLASNTSVYALEITPSRVEDLEATLAGLAEIIEITPADRRRFNRLLGESKRFESIPLRGKLSEEEVARFAVNRYRFPGVNVRNRLTRQYPLGAPFAHVVGYIGRISDRDVERLREEGRLSNYRGSDHIGKLGVERSYEPWLHGQTGVERVEVDSAGRAMRTLSRTSPRPGHDLTLHLDAGLQQVAEEVFGKFQGALVALDPSNGGVLALLSKPGFDPNLFIDGIDHITWRELNDSLERPLINRALRGVYPPGSTLKPFIALAGLELGMRRPDDAIVDPGFFSFPGHSHRFRDWKKDGHGVVDLKKSIVVSCDTYYYHLANQMGIRALSEYLSRFGFGKRTGIDLDGELPGLMPTPEWKLQRFRQPWWPGETVIAGIGQGYTLATPMQLAVATMALANRGVLYKPQLVRAWTDPASGRVTENPPRVLGRIEIKPAHLEVIRQAMVEVMEPGGTAAAAGAGMAYRMAGKTGTAQVKSIRQGERYDASRLAEQHRDHALFVAFAPAEAPRIVVAVMVENGGSGSGTAAPIARKVIDYWLFGKRPGAAVEVPATALPVADADESSDEEAVLANPDAGLIAEDRHEP